MKYRLREYHGFPKDLSALVVASGNGEVKLDLQASQVLIFEDVFGEPREWLP